jgi:hypothetical protein
MLISGLQSMQIIEVVITESTIEDNRGGLTRRVCTNGVFIGVQTAVAYSEFCARGRTSKGRSRSTFKTNSEVNANEFKETNVFMRTRLAGYPSQWLVQVVMRGHSRLY